MSIGRLTPEQRPTTPDDDTTSHEPEAEAIQGRTPLALAWRRLRKDKVAMISLVVIGLVFLLAIIAPLIAQWTGHGVNTQYRDSGALDENGLPVGPSSRFLFGTDPLGRDVLVRTAYGARISLLVGVTATLLTVVLGVTVGLVSGYFGGWVDTLLARLIDVILSVPFIMVAVALVSVFSPSLQIAILVIGFFSWASVARVVRGQVLSLRSQPFIEACRALGVRESRIFLRHILPNLVGPIMVYATLTVPSAILQESFLSFLGVGVNAPLPTWGSLASEGVAQMSPIKIHWWMIFFPCALLAITLLSLNFLGDGLRDVFDPKKEAAKI